MSSLSKFVKRCYESQHMTPREWGLLSVLLRLTKGGKSTLFFSGCNVATWFMGVSKSSIYRSVEMLESAGWLVPLNGSGRKRPKGSKRYEATMYTVLTHDQWTAKHGTEGCKKHEGQFPSTGIETGHSIPKDGNCEFPSTGMVNSQNEQNEFPYLGSSFVVPSSVKDNSVKASSIGAGSTPSEFQGQAEEVAEGTPSSPLFPSTGIESPKRIDWDAIEAKHGKGLEGLPQ